MTTRDRKHATIDLNNPDSFVNASRNACEHMIDLEFICQTVRGALVVRRHAEPATEDLRDRLIDRMRDFTDRGMEFRGEEIRSLFSGCIALNILEHITTATPEKDKQ